MTIYLFSDYYHKYFQIKDIHSFPKEYLSTWFPLLTSYQTFNLRLNRLSEAFKVLSLRLIDSFIPDDCDFDISLVDSMPIITCGGRNREAKVARELVTKGFCSTKNQYYFGLKLHALAFRRKGITPFPESITFTPAEDNDLTVFKQNWGDIISGRTTFEDKIYFDNKKIHCFKN